MNSLLKTLIGPLAFVLSLGAGAQAQTEPGEPARTTSIAAEGSLAAPGMPADRRRGARPEWTHAGRRICGSSCLSRQSGGD